MRGEGDIKGYWSGGADIFRKEDRNLLDANGRPFTLRIAHSDSGINWNVFVGYQRFYNRYSLSPDGQMKILKRESFSGKYLDENRKFQIFTKFPDERWEKDKYKFEASLLKEVIPFAELPSIGEE